jgi:tetratricopeptide (TPR) repeat protein
MGNLSVLETELGHYDEALHWGRRGFRLEPNVGIAYFNVAVPLLYMRDDEITARWLNEGEQRFPNDMRIQMSIAVLDIFRGRDREALERLRRAAASQPENGEVKFVMSDVASITHQADAESQTERLFQSAPDLGAGFSMLPESFRARYAYVLLHRGEKNRAASLMQQAVRLAREALAEGNELPRARLELAAIHAIRDQKEPALEWLQRAYDAGWRDSRTLARDPMFETLRGEPRFKELLSRMNRDVAAMRDRSPELRELSAHDADTKTSIAGRPKNERLRFKNGQQHAPPG